MAELVIAEIIALSRQLIDRAAELKHFQTWNKVSKACWEVRGKTLGIIGYGHIGTQVSVLAEALGITVVYYDIIPIMPLGSARQLDSLSDLFAASDFVTLHVPDLPETRNMIGASELSSMKVGSYLLNNARGSVLDIPALCDALESGHLAGAAIDVYPSEPAANGVNTFNDALNSWTSRLCQCRNVILTPHIGGSTEEAQAMIGKEVAQSLIRFLRFGSSVGAVNFPEVDLRPIVSEDKLIRLCYVHKNIPGLFLVMLYILSDPMTGVLRKINEILSDYNVEKQFSDSRGDIAYLMADISDVDREAVRGIHAAIQQTEAHISTRVLS